MRKAQKFNDMYPKTQYWTKLFIYSSIDFKNENILIDLFENLQDPCIISYKYGKGQQNMKRLCKKHNHRLIGYDFTNYKDYLQNIIRGIVKFIFIFADSSDSFSTNLLNVAKQHSIVRICYSNIDSKFHFYGIDNTEPIIMDSVEEVISGMKQMQTYISFKEIVDLFPDFDLIPESEIQSEPVLENCLRILKESNNNEQLKKDKKKSVIIKDKKFFDPKFHAIKKYYSGVNEVNVNNQLLQPVHSPSPSPKKKIIPFFKKTE